MASLLVDEQPYKVIFEDSKCVPGFDYFTTIRFADPSGAMISPPSGEPIILVYKLTESTSWSYNYKLDDDQPSPPAKELIDHDSYIRTQKLDDLGGTIGLTVLAGGFNHTTFSLSIEIHYGDGQTLESVLDVDCLYAKDATTGLISNSRVLAIASMDSAFVGDVVSFSYDSVGASGRVFWLLSSGQSTGPEPSRIITTGRFSSPSSTVDISIELDHIPELRFTVFSLDGTLLADYTTVIVKPGFTTTIANFSESTVLPGANISIDILAEGNSSVLIGVVDTSLLLSAIPNDITTDYVTSSVMPPASRFSCSYNQDANQALENSGLLLLASDFANLPIAGGFDGIVPYAGEGEIANDADASSETSTVQQRSWFPDSWIWTEIFMDSREKTLQYTAPDTITSWSLAAVSLGPETGIGIANIETLTTFKPFFASLAFPNEVIRNEEFDLNLTVFNYLDSDLVLDVECALPSQLEVSNEPLLDSLDLSITNEGSLIGVWDVPSKKSVTRSVPVKATMIGSFPFSFTGAPNDTHPLSMIPGDSVTANILVSSEGLPKSLTNNIQLEGLGTVYNPAWHQMDLIWPVNRVMGSEELVISLSGDLMGATVASLDYLITQPTGCGEQNIVLTAPQVYAYKYMLATNQLSQSQKLDIIRNLHTGYTRELFFLHTGENAGAFSAFGNSDPEPSSWLTAFVVSVFVDIIDVESGLEENIVDPAIVTDAVSYPLRKILFSFTACEKLLRWLLSTQSDDGKFPRIGRVLHGAMMGGISDTDSLTCFITNALVKARDIGLAQSGTADGNRVDLALEQARAIVISYLNKPLGPDDVYPFSVCAHTYLRYDSTEMKSDIYNKLVLIAKSTYDMKWWDNKHHADTSLRPDDGCWDCNERDGHAVAVEMTAYNLLSILEITNSINGKAAANWLIKQRNEHGGFSSTQDTCMGLKALAEFAKTASSAKLDLQLELKLGEGAVTQMSVSESNKYIYQIRYLPVHDAYPEPLFQYRVLGGSSGTAYLGVTQRYNYIPDILHSHPFRGTHMLVMHAESNVSPFNLAVHYDSDSPTCTELLVETSWISSEDSGMVILNARSVSGCCFEDSIMTAYQNDTLVRMIELECSQLTVYLDHLDSATQSFNFPQYQLSPIKNSHGQMVYVQQYYNPAIIRSSMYRTSETSDGSSLPSLQESGSQTLTTLSIFCFLFSFYV